MNKHLRLLTLAAATLALFSSVGCSKLRARDQLNKGVTAYKNAKYEEAIDHFQQSRCTGSHSDQRQNVSGHRLCPAIHSRRRYAR